MLIFLCLPIDSCFTAAYFAKRKMWSAFFFSVSVVIVLKSIVMGALYLREVAKKFHDNEERLIRESGRKGGRGVEGVG